MSGQVIEFPTAPSLMDAVREAAFFGETARYTSGVPVVLVNAFRACEPRTVDTTVRGEPVTVTTGEGRLTDAEGFYTWQAMLAAAPPAGSRIHIGGGGRVLVDCTPDPVGGAA